jgi:hypothetical protein
LPPWVRGRDMLDDRCNGELSGDRDPRGRFAGGNPGRPRGARNHATRAAESLLEGQTEALTTKAIEMALAGDITALRLCLDRILPVRKDRPVEVDLPVVETAADHAPALAAVAAAVALGDLAPAEGKAVAEVLELHRKAIETAELERRISDLEARTK